MKSGVVLIIYRVDEQIVTLQHYYKNNNTNEFFNLVEQVLLQLKENQQYSQYISCAMDKATLYFRLQNYTLAIQTLSEVSLLIGEHASASQQIRYYNLLAAIHGANQTYKEAYEYLEMARYLSEKVQDKFMLIRIYHNLSAYYFELENYEESLLYCQKSLAYYADVYEQMPKNYLLNLTYARVLIKLNRLEEAEILIKREEQTLCNKEVSRFTMQLKLAQTEYLVQQQKLTEGYQLLKQSLELFEHEPKWLVELYSELCKLSKLCNSSAHYLEDLRAFYQLKKDVIEKQRQEQLQAIHYYFDERPYKEMSWNDPLTNVNNRRFLEENYKPYMDAHTFVMFDIDQFKSINDQYGHLTGDKTIQMVAVAAQELFAQQEGLFVRLGGDEFAASLPISSAEELHKLLQKFIEEIRSLHIPYEQELLQITISIGAYYSVQPLELSTALQLADRALYEAKRNGRNQFVIHMPEGG